MIILKAISNNCSKCPSYINKECDGNDYKCICKKCPRNLGECIITKYCRETESILNSYE